MAGVLSHSEEKTNFSKLARLLIDGGTAALRAILDRFHPPGTLAASLNSATNIAKLQKLYPPKGRVLNKRQWDTLFPPVGSPPPSSQHMDVTLVFVLLRNICPLLVAPVTGWDNLPANTDTSIGANLARIKFYRNNVYGHIRSTAVPKADFETYWREISAALVALGFNQEEMNELKAAPFVTEDYIKLLGQWIESDLEMSKELLELKLEIREMKETMQKHSSGTQSQPLCKEKFHETEALKYYCRKCDRTVCYACTLSEEHHKGHDVVTVDKQANAVKELLLVQKEKLQTKSREIQASIQHLNELKKQVDMYSKHANLEVDRMVEQFRNILEQTERGLKVEIQQRQEETYEMLDKEMQGLDALNSQVTDICDCTTSVVHGSSSGEILEINTSLQERCTHLLNTQKAEPQINPIIRFVPSNIIEVFHKEELGYITDKAGAISKRTEGPSRALSPVKLSIQYSNPKDKIECKVHPETKVKNFKMCEGVRGRHDVEFTPTIPGEFRMTAQMNGSHIVNSPMDITVQEQEMKVTGAFQVKGVKALKTPSVIAVNKDNGHVAIADSDSRCVYVVDMQGALISTTKGISKKELMDPCGVAFLNSTEIVIGDYGNGSLRLFNYKTGKQVWSMQAFRPRTIKSIYVSSDEEVIACGDVGLSNPQIIVYDAHGKREQTLDVKQLTGCDIIPTCCITHGNTWIISDILNDCIHVVDRRVHSKTMKIGRKGGADGELCRPHGLAVDGDGNVLVCDMGNKRVEKFTLDGGEFVGKCELDLNPIEIAVLSDGSLLVIVTDEYMSYVECMSYALIIK